jgi:hypothetical protein
MPLLVLAASIASYGQVAAPLPQIRQHGAVKQFYVDNKPFIMLSGELHNSSASSPEYMKPKWDKLAGMHLNTVVGTASWELVEPEEGRFDFTAVDAQIREARLRKMRLVLIWFATWKNGGSGYVPHWVKSDQKRFPRMLLKPRPGGTTREFGGQGGIGSLSPFGEESLKADMKAFRALMRHIKAFDPQHTVIMMQVQNESGSLGDSRDRSPLAEAAWRKAVPADLMSYLVKNRATLLPEIQEVWARNGFKAEGTWTEVFGSDEWADEVFMAYHMGRYIGDIAKAGRAELNIPMYANAWLGPQPGQELPGQWPSGGPVARMMDVYRAAAPSLDLIAPDIYVPDFKGTCALYNRSGNPLFIPEAADKVGNLFWSLGHHAALGWSPFGIEDLNSDGQVAEAYKLLSTVLPQLVDWQAAGKVEAILAPEGEKQTPISLGGYKITLSVRRRWRPPTAPTAPAGQPTPSAPAPVEPVLGPGGVSFGTRALPPDARLFALVVNTAPDEFLFIGSNGVPTFEPDLPGTGRVAISAKDEGRFENGKWVGGRRLNGDESGSGLPSGSIGMLKVKLVRLD